MSLLMDALKQAEHAKRGKQPDTTPPETPAAYAPVDEAADTRAQLSLAPVEISSQSEIETVPDAGVTAATPFEQAAAPEPIALATAAPLGQTPDTAVAPAAPAASAAQPERGARLAARILAASESRQAALRRRNLLGGSALAAVLTLAIGSYYYYATLAQTQPYLAPPQRAEAAPDPVDDQTASAEITPTQGAIETAAAATASPPAHTPWQSGPEPAPVETQPWEPAPVDPRVLRGEPPVATPDVPEEAEPAATTPAPSIRITRSSQPNRVSALLLAAYEDYRQGRWIQAEQGYREVLAQERSNRDARLGLAALAVRAGHLETAREHYRELLRRNPKDNAALAALSDLNQSAAGSSESELKLRLTEQPQAAQLHFALANLYAVQQRWPLAQQAYFEAQRLAPDNADYTFNLAVSLEHLGQSAPALAYYRRAVQLAGAQASRFDNGIAQQRIAALSAQTAP